MSGYIIAGVDPGATLGIAIIDLSGRKIATQSASGGLADAARIIERYGTPSLIACDVSHPPELALKLSSYFSCHLYSPLRDIREEEKNQIARGAGVENNHERDAYCAAVLAFRAHANKLRQIDAFPDLTEAEKDKLKHLKLRGYHLQDAFVALREQPDEELPPSQMKKPEQRPLSAEDLHKRASLLARENANLRLLLARLENEKRQLESRLRLLENGVRQNMLRDSEIRKLRFQLQQALLRLSFHKKNRMARADRHAAQPEKLKAASAQQGEILNMEEEKVDLEQMVMDYRKGQRRS